MATMIPSTRVSKRTTYKVIEAGNYPARMVRFIGLGIQPQRAFQGQEKSPAFKCSIQWELYDPNTAQRLSAIEIKEGQEVVTEKPSCMFQEMFLFPNAERGKVFDMSKAFEPNIKKSPADLDWFFDKLGQAAMITVSRYQKKDGTFGNGVQGVLPIAPMIVNAMAPAVSPLVGFNPYIDTQDNKVAYSMMFPFQRDILKEAGDAQHIPLAGTEPIKLEAVNGVDATAPEGVEVDVPFETSDSTLVNPFM